MTNVLAQEDREVAEVYGAHGTPSAVLVSHDGEIASSLAMGADAITDLVVRATERQFELLAAQRRPAPAQRRPAPPRQLDPVRKPTLRIGDEVPDLAWEDLDGNPIALRGLGGHSLLLLFWSPRCGFCQRMVSHLKAWEESAVSSQPRVLVISTGTETENRSLGLNLPIVLEDSFRSGRLFEAGGTPSAVLIDAEGRLATPVAVGSAAILEMLGVDVQNSGRDIIMPHTAS